MPTLRALPEPTRHRAGFTLLEVVVALALLAGALLAAAQLIAVAAAAGERSRVLSLATVLAGQKLEQLRSLALGVGLDGAVVVDGDSSLACDSAPGTGGGTGIAESPPGTLEANVAGFVDYLDASGRCVGSGGSPPGSAAFARRWEIRSDPAAAAGTTFVFAVVLLRKGPPGSSKAGAGSAWLPTVRLDGAKTRRIL